MTFVINRWVRGEDFFGRESLLNALRDGIGKPHWILGNRRVGKTSLLRQIVWLCRQGTWSQTHAMYWDLQGAGTVAGLKDSFLESLEDQPDIAQRLDLDVDDLEDQDFGQILGKFRRKLKSLASPERLLLLVDECEELVDVGKKEPHVLSWFRKLGMSSERFSIVLAGSLRFMDLDESKARTSPMMPDYLPPLALGPFTQGQTLALLLKNGLTEIDALRIHNLSFGNPHLVQVMGELYLRLKDWPAVFLDVKQHRITQYFFQSNFQCLPEEMRHWFAEGTAINGLAGLEKGTAFFDYAVHSCLIRPKPDGGIEISPLLLMELGEQPDMVSVSRTVTAAKASQKPSVWGKLGEFFNYLAQVSPPLTTLPRAVFENHHLDIQERPQDPPSLECMASLGESKARMLEVVASASPEYVLETPADTRTAVYLFGLYLYHLCFGELPLAGEEEPWAAAGNLADMDVDIRPEKSRLEMPGKLAMILMRCLRADRELRYPNLETLKGDLEEVIAWSTPA